MPAAVNTSGPVLVIGAGPGGTALTLALQRSGRHPQLFEARSYAGTQYGGCYVLWYAGVKSLARLGLAEAAHRAGNPMRRLEMCDHRGRVLFSADIGRRGEDLAGIPLAIRRADLLSVLYSALEPGSIRLDSTLRDVTEETGGIAARFTDGHRAEGSVLVGADGLSSTVRTHLHRFAPPRHPGYAHWSGAATGVDAVPDGTFRIMHGGGNRFAFFRLGGDQVYWWCTRPAPADRSGNLLGRKEALHALVEDWDPVTRRLLDATDAAEITRRDTMDRPLLKTWGRGRITLLGDAAHAMTFDLGQGAGTALTDALALADELTGGAGTLRALRTYERRRREVVGPIVTASRRIGAAAGWQSPLGRRANGLILRSIGAKITPALLERDALSHPDAIPAASDPGPAAGFSTEPSLPGAEPQHLNGKVGDSAATPPALEPKAGR